MPAASSIGPTPTRTIPRDRSIVPVRLARAEACWLEGRTADAVTEAERADEAADTDDAWTYGAVAAWLWRTGSSRRPRGQVAEPYQHELNGHWEKAAQLWTDLGCPYEAALVRLDQEGLEVRNELHAEVPGPVLRHVGVVRHDTHPEGRHALGDQHADASQPDDAERLVLQLHAAELRALPGAGGPS